MDAAGLTCHGCGSTNVIFDAKTRVLHCNQRGSRQTYSRATLNKNGKVVFCKQNALGFFQSGQFDKAKHYSMDILNISMDNVTALYMMAFYDEFYEKRDGSMRSFFRQADEVALEYEEVLDLQKLISASAVRLINFEKEIITLFAKNMQSNEEADDLCQMIDKVCPYFIANRTSADFLDRELVELYKELAEHCSIPKTCFALLKGIETNPDSPFSDNSFYLQGKTKYFYEQYICAVREIIESMKDANYKAKFMAAYQSKVQAYKAASNGTI